MTELRKQTIKEYLQDENSQEHIRKRIYEVRSEAAVAIGSVVEILGFSENQLRDWEKRGWLNPQRSVKTLPSEQENKTVNRHRRYSLAELDKLSVIRELLKNGFTPNEITQDIQSIDISVEQLFVGLDTEKGSSVQKEKLGLSLTQNETNISSSTEHVHIDQYAYIAYKDLFWRYYASEALRLSTYLVCEGIFPIAAGLILPMKNQEFISINSVKDVAKLGKSLVGWLGQTRSFYTYLTDYPSFEYPSDYRILQLKTNEEDAPRDRTWIVVEREAAKHIVLEKAVVETIRQLLAPLYEDVQDWQRFFGAGMRDLVFPASDFTNGLNLSDIILSGIANTVVRLGGKASNKQNLWRFCCILLPSNSSLPLEQQPLIIRAQSKSSPHIIGITTVTPEEPLSISLRTYQSGNITYRSVVSDEDTAIAYRKTEDAIKSVIAVPIGSEKQLPIAVLYCVSDFVHAFPAEKQSALRVICKMVEKLLLIYQDQKLDSEELTKLVTNNSSTSQSLNVFPSESIFIEDTIDIVRTIPQIIEDKKGHLSSEDVLSFISIDVDNQASLANKYGDVLTRNLSRVVGQRIQSHLQSLVSKNSAYKLYHIYADRFYLLMDKLPLDQARDRADQLRKTLKDSYKVNAVRFEQGPSPNSMLDLTNVTVRVGVTSYEYTKLKEILERYDAKTAYSSVVALIMRSLDEVLDQGRHAKGDVVFSWDPVLKDYVRWSSESKQE